MQSDEVWIRSPSLDFLSVSSFGRVLIDPTFIEMPNGGFRKYETKPTLGVIQTNGNNQRYVFRNRMRGINNKKVHQLVCEAFYGPKPFEDAVVMHIDDNPLNNHKDNLKWGTQKENLNSEKFINYCKTRVGEKSTHAIRRRSVVNNTA